MIPLDKRQEWQYTYPMDLLEIITDAMREQDVSSYRLARLSGVPERTVMRFTAGQNELRAKALAKLLDALGMEIRRKKGKDR